MTLSTDKINKEVKEDNKKLNKDNIDKLRKFLEENRGKFPQMEPYRPPSWFKRIDPKTLPSDLERRYKDLEKRFARKQINKKRGVIGPDDIAKAKGGTIKVYAKGGGVRKVNY